jgi:hypothetical protein
VQMLSDSARCWTPSEHITRLQHLQLLQLQCSSEFVELDQGMCINVYADAALFRYGGSAALAVVLQRISSRSQCICMLFGV